MPQIIEIPELGQVEFPDDMTDEEISAAIQQNLAGGSEMPQPAPSMGIAPDVPQVGVQASVEGIPAGVTGYSRAVEEGYAPEYAEQAPAIDETRAIRPEPRPESTARRLGREARDWVVPEWGRKHPRLYGVAGAAYETTKPVIEMGALTGGAIAGSEAGPPGMVVGGALGYAGGQRITKILGELLGVEDPETLSEALIQTAKDIKTGAMYEMGGQVAGPILKETGKQVKRAVKPITEALPKKLYTSAVKMPTTLPPEKRAKIAETALKERIPPTAKGLGKLAEQERALITKIDDAVELATKRKGKISTSDITSKLDDAYEMARLSDDPIGYKKIVDGAVERFAAHGESITVKEAHQIKRNIYKMLPSKAFEKSFAPRETMKIKVSKAMSRGAKEAVEEAVPGIKQMNKKAGELIELSEVLQRAVSRIENNNLIGLNTELAATAGAVVAGIPGATAAGVGRSLLGLPRTKARIAMALYKGGPVGRFKETFYTTPSGKALFNTITSVTVQKILKSRMSDKDKEKFLIKEFKKGRK